jgi:arylsulfatase A-like enzyme
MSTSDVKPEKLPLESRMRMTRRDALKGTAAGAAAGMLGAAPLQAAAQEGTPSPAASPAATPPPLAEPGEEVVGLTVDESTPARSGPVQAPEGAPNVLFWVVDDIGYGQTSPYGGPIETPSLQRLVDAGLLYTNFHTTALCSPTRSCLLTGRNHHANHMATVSEIGTGYPGYDARIPLENGFLSEILVAQGYAAYAVGKWHLTPFDDLHLGGSREQWPLGRGFERYYGFLGGETNQWEPALVNNNDFVDQPKSPEEGYHLSEDLTERTITYIQDLKAATPDKPFFLYLAYGAGHAPHHSPQAWSERYRGRFDDGWDVLREETYRRQLELGIIPPGTELPERDPAIPAWDSFAEDEQRLFARMMEVFAGYVSHMDDQFGRVLDFLEAIGQLDNTLIAYVSDNGASAEGGPVGSINEYLFLNYVPEDIERNLAMIDELGTPATYNHYPWGWTWAGNTPFRRWKRETHRGGISDPFVISWPKGISATGERRTQYLHAIDLVPTVLEAAGIQPPDRVREFPQSDMHGRSFVESFADPEAASPRHTQYYEMFATRSIYHDGWQAVCQWPLDKPLTVETLQELDPAGWELYHVEEDFSEANNVAGEYPEKVEEMVSRWWAEAGKYNVLPLDPRLASRTLDPSAPSAPPRPQYVYFPGGGEVAASAAPPVLNRSHAITAEVEIPAGGAEGVLLAVGGRFGGYSFYIQDGTLTYVHNYVGLEEYRVEAPGTVPTGGHTLKYSFEVTGEPDFSTGKGAPGIGRLYIDDDLVAETEIPVTVPLLWPLGENLTCGYDKRSVVTDAYAPPFAFTGTLHRVVVDVDLD